MKIASVCSCFSCKRATGTMNVRGDLVLCLSTAKKSTLDAPARTCLVPVLRSAQVRRVRGECWVMRGSYVCYICWQQARPRFINHFNKTMLALPPRKLIRRAQTDSCNTGIMIKKISPLPRWRLCASNRDSYPRLQCLTNSTRFGPLSCHRTRIDNRMQLGKTASQLIWVRDSFASGETASRSIHATYGHIADEERARDRHKASQGCPIHT